jgi:signal transduction histidine kinase
MGLTQVRLAGAMAVSVALVAGLVYWDAERESAAALDDLAAEQATVARALAAGLKAGQGSEALGAGDVFAGLRAVERPQALSAFLHRPNEPLLRRAAGGEVRSSTVLEAIARGEASVRIGRDEAPAFGLPRRTALAGIARLAGGLGEAVVVATAERERDRQVWARRRLLGSVLTAAGLVVVFGGIAVRNQRKELVLERELAVSALRESQNERLERASRAAALGTLAMGVAHEISTPLGVIAARAEQMLPRLEGDERLGGGARAILAQTERIGQVIRGLLGLARGDTPSAERIDPGDVVREAAALVEHRFARAGVRLEREEGGDLPSVLGDPRLLEHAVVNLLLNACDASAPGDTVVVRADRDGGSVVLVVEDAGAGISPADRERALEPFFTTKARGEGTGLGLAIAREIVASHRGAIAFRSREPRGTAVEIRLPPAEGAADA